MNQIGQLIENSNVFVQAVESGSFEDTFTDGVRTRVVSNIYTCLKSDVQSVIRSLSTYPSALLSDGGRNPDGTLADYINWGEGYASAGNDVSEISPGFSRITAKYTADDPAGAEGQARTGNVSGGIIGKPWENGERYAESPDSGRMSEERIYDEDSDTWTRTRSVDRVITCLRTDARIVADGLDLTPDDLTTRGVSWGAGYELYKVSGQPISPSFMQIIATYRIEMSDPEAPAQVTAYSGTSVIGKPWMNGNIYAETQESGRVSDDRVYDEDSYGWNRVRTVNKVLICLNCDVVTVCNGLEADPNVLTTNENEDSEINWGRQYHLVGMSAQAISPSLTQVTAKYRAELPEAIITPPENLNLACSAGVCSITWKDTLFETLDSGLPLLDYGIEVAYSGYTINMYCNGVLFDSFTASGTPTTRVLEWVVTDTTATLTWCGQKWREYAV